MRQNIKKIVFYTVVTVIIFVGQFVLNHGLKMGIPPAIEQKTMRGQDAMTIILKGPAIIYFWAEWCGVCNLMQPAMNEVSLDSSVLTVAIKSGSEQKVQEYLRHKKLNWNVVNDPLGQIAEQYQARGVPSIFFLNNQGEIVLTSSGYTSEVGLRLRLWMASML
jgi:thiol-disulfide isomerase/thioredoxin